ncbi:MAG: rod shape-determining protein MreD [Acidobacteria bacterium]|nr:rod shape-determining protein MreD [Acidobacteriota bacterium]
MKYLFLGLMSFLAILAQMIGGKNFFLFNFLDLSLILVAYWAVYRNRMQSLFVGSLAGLLLDAAMGWPLGYNGFGKTLAAFLIGQSWKKFNTSDQTWVRFSIIAASSWLSSLGILGLFWLMERSTSGMFLGASLLQAFITAAVAVIVFAGLDSYRRTQMHKVH